MGLGATVKFVFLHFEGPNVSLIHALAVTSRTHSSTDSTRPHPAVRVTEKVDLSTTVKFVFLHFEGPNLPFVKKGRYAVVRGNVTRDYFNPFHVDMTCITDPSDVTEEIIMQKVADAR